MNGFNIVDVKPLMGGLDALFEDNNVDYMILGGMAVQAHVASNYNHIRGLKQVLRKTKDIDIYVGSEYLPEGFYRDLDSIGKREVRLHSHGVEIEVYSGLEISIYFFEQSHTNKEFNEMLYKRKRLKVYKSEAWFADEESLIENKISVLDKRKGPKKYSDCYDIWLLNILTENKFNPFRNEIFRSFIEGFSGYIKGNLDVDSEIRQYYDMMRRFLVMRNKR